MRLITTSTSITILSFATLATAHLSISTTWNTNTTTSSTKTSATTPSSFPSTNIVQNSHLSSPAAIFSSNNYHSTNRIAASPVAEAISVQATTTNTPTALIPLKSQFSNFIINKKRAYINKNKDWECAKYCALATGQYNSCKRDADDNPDTPDRDCLCYMSPVFRNFAEKCISVCSNTEFASYGKSVAAGAEQCGFDF